jgi:hypothetical protein
LIFIIIPDLQCIAIKTIHEDYVVEYIFFDGQDKTNISAASLGGCNLGIFHSKLFSLSIEIAELNALKGLTASEDPGMGQNVMSGASLASTQTTTTVAPLTQPYPAYISRWERAIQAAEEMIANTSGRRKKPDLNNPGLISKISTVKRGREKRPEGQDPPPIFCVHVRVISVLSRILKIRNNI